jgi:DNA-binding LytR/AlgR family response regulator
LVNKDRIKGYRKKELEVILDDDTVLPVSRAGMRLLKTILA